jgi:hypothetical protein
MPVTSLLTYGEVATKPAAAGEPCVHLTWRDHSTPGPTLHGHLQGAGQPGQIFPARNWRQPRLKPLLGLTPVVLASGPVLGWPAATDLKSRLLCISLEPIYPGKSGGEGAVTAYLQKQFVFMVQYKYLT